MGDPERRPRAAARAQAWRYAAELSRRVPLNHALWRASEAAVLAELPMARPILDVGCGDGLFAKLLFPEPVDVGIDLSISRLTRARGSGAYLELRAANAARLPYDDGTFGTVFSNCVLEHIPDVDAVCREAARVLRPGGQFIFTVPTDRFADFLFYPTLLRGLGLGWLARGYVRALNQVFQHHHTDSPRRWTERLESVGLEVTEIREIMPRPLHALWDLLMPFATLHLFVKKAVPGWPFPIQRLLLRLWREPLEYLMVPRGAPGGNMVVVARKPDAR